MMKPGYVYRKMGKQRPWLVKCLEVRGTSALISFRSFPYPDTWIRAVTQQSYMSLGKAVTPVDHPEGDY